MKSKGLWGLFIAISILAIVIFYGVKHPPPRNESPKPSPAEPKISGTSQSAEAAKAVTIVYSYEADFWVTIAEDRGVTAALADNAYIEGKNLTVTRIHMDTKTVNKSVEKMAGITPGIVAQIKRTKPDVVLLFDDNAAKFIGAELLHSYLPVVFGSVNGSPTQTDYTRAGALAASLDTPGHNITGILERMPVLAGFEIMETLNPKARTAALISDDSTTTRAIIETMGGLEALDRAALGILILTAITLRFVILGIARPISKLTRASAALARGEEVEELKAGSTDEIGILTTTFIQMRDAIRDQFAKIRESEEKHRRLVENLGREYFFFTHGTDGIFFYVSPSVTEMLGYDQTEFMTHYTAYLTDNPINQAAETRTEECIKGIKQPPHQVEIKHKSDGFRRLEVTQAPILAPGGKVTAVEGLAHDVTDKIRMEELMIQSEKMLSVGGLAAGMAHEINNPLAGMMQTAWVMANRLDSKMHIPANIKAAHQAGTSIEAISSFMEARGILRMITNIIESGRRVAEIVDNMLSFARKSDARLSSHDMADLLDKSLELATTDYDLKKHYDFKKIEIRKEYEEDLPPVPCEGAKIQQVLINILRNGAQAMQESGTLKPRFIVRTYVKPEREMICMEIEDNGPGMAEATRKRVFEPFFTTKTVGLGTGLGLSVSYFIITENHGGEMAVESRPGAGTKFIIHLPLEGRQANALTTGTGTL